MLDLRSFRAMARSMILILAIAVVGACGGTAFVPPASTPSTNAAAPTNDSGGATETDDDGSTSAGDRAKGFAQFQLSGGLTETLDLPFAAVLSLWESSGPGSAYLPFTDEDAVLFLTIDGGRLLVQYARTSTSAGVSSGATPCTLTTDILDAASAKGSFSCTGMTMIQGETVGSADMKGIFEARK